MPHSVSSDTSSRPEEEDRVLPDAPSESEETSEHHDPQSTTEEDNEKEIEKIKQEVKLEDLFNDDDDEDEFTSSGSTADSKMEIDSWPAKAPEYV